MTKTTPKTSDDYDAKGLGLAKQLRELQVRAGIDGKIEDAHQNSFDPMYYDSDAPLFSRQSLRESELEFEVARENIRRTVRQYYFAVSDVDLRKELIEKERELTDIHRWNMRDKAFEAHARIQAAAATWQYWWVVAAVFAVSSVVGGAALYQVTGAIAGAMVAYFFGRSFEDAAKEQRAAAIKAAEEVHREAQATADRALNAPYTFTRNEMRTGKPDPICDRRQAE